MAGLACAAALTGRAEVVALERLPVTGGEHWEEARVARLVASAAAAGTRFLLGTQAIRWNGVDVVAAGQEAGMVEAAALVVATGHRPRTRSEAAIEGSRAVVMLPATVALHLLHHRVGLGEHVTVVGAGRWARRVVPALLERGTAEVTVVADRPEANTVSMSRVTVVAGRARRAIADGVNGTALEVEGEGATVRVACDRVVLAAGRVPYRNVDGAILQAPGVVFAQAGDASEDENASEEAGVAAASEALRKAGEGRRRRTLPLRTGAPG